jgi:hypothetical protein
VVEKLKLSKNNFKKCSPKQLFLKVRFWHFLTRPQCYAKQRMSRL